jgi:hypothetical protein
MPRDERGLLALLKYSGGTRNVPAFRGTTLDEATCNDPMGFEWVAKCV